MTVLDEIVQDQLRTDLPELASGDTVMIGGLIDRRVSNDDRGAPVASDIPLFGKLFGNQRTSHSSRELVMVLRVNVL